ncbi:dihydroorotate dehydrogenase electron transfer subunit [candidate division KSB1 bacterium]
MALPSAASRLVEVKSRIISVSQISSSGYVFEFEAPVIAEIAQPGQFVQIRVSSAYTPLLRRPFSVLKTDKTKGSIYILFKVFGTATKILSSKNAGDHVDLLGPLGNTFRLESYQQLFIAGGGIGIPPLYFLLTSLMHGKKDIRVYLGAQTGDELWYSHEIRKFDIPFITTTEDGSSGEKGLVTRPLEEDLKKLQDKSRACIAACGPLPMLSAIQNLAMKYEISAQLSVETIMACGFGICMGCVLPNHGETESYSLVCKDGPVFQKGDLVI